MTEGRRSRLRRIAMNTFWSKDRLCDIGKARRRLFVIRFEKWGLDVSLTNEHAVIETIGFLANFLGG
jgi:hypothetical protein